MMARALFRIAVVAVVSSATARAQASDPLPGETILAIDPAQAAGSSARISRSKVGSDLLRWSNAARRSEPELVADWIRRQPIGVAVDARNRVAVDIVAHDVATVRAFLEGLGAVGIRARGRLMGAMVPLTRLTALQDEAAVRYAIPSYSIRSQGSVTTEGDAVMGSDLARANLGVDGAGVTVGVLSDSYDCLLGASSDIASNDLPVPLSTNDPVCTTGETDEGRAMMQIVHDIAPNAALRFETTVGTTTDLANAIDDLASLGVHIIVNDVLKAAEPMFQDGEVAQAVNDARNTNDVLFVSAAGNAADRSYESPFRASADTSEGNTRHDFDPGTPDVSQQTITVPVGGSAVIVLQWNDPYGSAGPVGASTDLDIRMRSIDDDLLAVPSSGGQCLSSNANCPIALLGGGTGCQLGSCLDNLAIEDPIEVFTFTNPGLDFDGDLQLDTEFLLDISIVAGPQPSLLKTVIFPPGDYDALADPTSTVYGHPNAEGSFSVGAYSSLDLVIQDFTSIGGTDVLFDAAGLPQTDVRRQPVMLGVDDGNTTFFGTDLDGDGFPNFTGTSAAAPHVAGVAALMLDAAPNASANDIARILLDSSIAIGDPGFDTRTGAGLIDAEKAVQGAVDQAAGALRLGFSASQRGIPLVTSSTVGDQFEALGFTISAGANDVTVEDPLLPTPTFGFNGNYVMTDAGAGPPVELELTFDRVVGRIELSAAHDGTRLTLTARDAVGDVIRSLEPTLTATIAIGSVSASAGTISAAFGEPITTVTLEVAGGTLLAIDDLEFDEMLAPRVPALPAAAAGGLGVVLLSCLAAAVRRRRS